MTVVCKGEDSGCALQLEMEAQDKLGQLDKDRDFKGSMFEWAYDLMGMGYTNGFVLAFDGYHEDTIRPYGLSCWTGEGQRRYFEG